jgi:SagB-type dehydrogenase family enzyme
VTDSIHSPTPAPDRDFATPRRRFLQGMAATGAAISLGSSVAWGATVKLPAPRLLGGLPILEAFAKRHSTRRFDTRLLPQQILSDLLWAAFGVNRPDTADHTAPSWHGSKETDIYIAMKDGVWRYEPVTHELRSVMSADIRKQTSAMAFVATAPAVLIYVADRRRMAEATPDEHRLYAHVDAAIIAENVYLSAAAAGLGTVLLGSVDRDALGKTLSLPADQVVTFSQPVGFAK